MEKGVWVGGVFGRHVHRTERICFCTKTSCFVFICGLVGVEEGRGSRGRRRKESG